MKTITKKYPRPSFLNQVNLDFPIEDTVFFDIETTGFHREKCFIYLIGVAVVNHDNIMLTQWMIENQNDEKLVLQSFLEFINYKKVLMSFNGEGFDIPFIENRIHKYRLSTIPKDLQSIDLLKWVKQRKDKFPLVDFKLKTIERFLGIYRQDMYSGGQLIEVLFDYLNHHKKGDLENLLLHNAEDIYYMTYLLKLYILDEESHVSLTPFIEIQEVKIEHGMLSVRLMVQVPDWSNFSYKQDLFSLQYISSTQELIFSARLFSGTLFYFFENYKEYYYFPSLDEAIHKSMAKFMEDPKKELAKASNCYTKKEAIFMSCPLVVKKLPMYQQKAKDTKYFLEVLVNEDGTLSQDWLTSVLISLLPPF